MPRPPRKNHGASAAERATADGSPEVRRGAMYAQIPTDVLGDRMLLPIDKVILALLTDHDNGSYCCWPTNTTLAAEAGCCTKTVYLALRRLQRLGWITVEPCPTVERGQLIRLNWRRPAARDRRGGGRKCISGGVGNAFPPI
jgi:hypothetical protein